MSVDEWNHGHPTGTLVEVTLTDGRTINTRTLGKAKTWGGLDHVEVAGISGFVLLSWVRRRPNDRNPIATN